jgi:aldose 1-epimerase
MKRLETDWHGQPLFQITLYSDQMQVDVLNFGAVLQRIAWAGKDYNLCLGYPTVDPYLTNPGKFGAIVGRYANRINQAQAVIDGVPYKFDANNGAHCLHGGRETLGLRAFDVLEHSGSHVVLFQRMPDGHMGFPGTLDVWVTYRLRGATLGSDIRAKTDATTLCNITGHSYFNFTGAPTIADHQLQVAASQILPVDETGIPSGAKMNVTGTQFDFQTPTALTQGDRPVMIDHNYCVSDDRMEMRPIAWLSGGDTRMELASTEPGLQVYTGAGLGADLPSVPTGRAFHPYAGIALEPQIWPDSPNRPEFAQAILRPNDEYHHQIEYRFTQDVML